MANNINGASLNPIYQRLHDAPQYHPLEADTFADWAMEAGDIVTVSRDGKSYESPVHSSTVTWKKGQQVTVSSTGQEKRDSVTKMSQKKYNRGSSGLRNSENRYRQIVTSYNEMTAGLILASSSAALYVNNKYTQMQSGLSLTESSAHLYTNNKYTQMSSGLKLTESSAHLYTNNKYTQMSSGLKLSESSAHLYADNKYSQMTAGLKLSESSAHLYVNNKYSQMTSGLKLSESSAHLYTNNKYTQMSSGLKLTESSAHLYTDNRYTQMSSGLKLSEASAHLYVDSKYTQMQSGLAVTMSSATLYAQNRTTRAYIMTRINADGEGEALINAEKVKIAGTTTINNVFTVISNAVGVKVPLICDGNVDISSNKVLNLYTATFQGSNPVTLTALNLAGVIKSASVSNNTLTLTPFIGDEITFSKATSLSGEWSSGHLEVTASPQNRKYHQYIIEGTAEGSTAGSEASGNIWYIPVLAKDDPASSDSTRTGLRVIVNATARYNAGLSDYYSSQYWAKATAANSWNAKIPKSDNSGSEDWDCGASDAHTQGKKDANVTLSRSNVTEDSAYQKYLTYKASNNSNTSHNQTEKIYLVKATGKAQLRSGSATGTIIMEISTT